MKFEAVRFGTTGLPVALSSSFQILHTCPSDGVLWDDVFLAFHLTSVTGSTEVVVRLNGITHWVNVTISNQCFRLDRFRIFPGQTVEARLGGAVAVTAIGNVVRVRK